MDKIPCTVAILTRNSAATILRALESVKEFDDILICDGGSTDETLLIAKTFGARVIYQDSQFQDKDGRLRDFSGVRNQTLAAATHEWFFFLDSDEYLSSALVDDVRAAVAARVPAAYWVPRLYVYRGKIIDRAVTYPNRQMRFFHRSVAHGFIKEVHERIDLVEGAHRKEFHTHLLVPIEDSVADMKRKWLHYLAVESARQPILTWRQWIRGALRESLIAGLYIVRFVRNLFFSGGTRLPMRFELARLWYQIAAVKTSWYRVRGW